MNWEALSAISTAFTGIVILLTVIYAARQAARSRSSRKHSERSLNASARLSRTGCSTRTCCSTLWVTSFGSPRPRSEEIAFEHIPRSKERDAVHSALA